MKELQLDNNISQEIPIKDICPVLNPNDDVSPSPNYSLQEKDNVINSSQTSSEKIDNDSDTNNQIDSSGNTVTPNTPVNDNLWHPDTNLDANQNLNSLWQWINNLITNGVNLSSDLFSGQQYIDILQNIGKSVMNLIDELDLNDKDKAAQLSFLEKVANVAQSYIDNIFSQALSYQSWYMQQEYNTPANQLKRLEEAGLSSAFIFGNGYSNTAQSPASGSSAGFATNTMSGAGEIQANLAASERQQRVGLLGALAQNGEAVSSLLNVGVNSFKTLAEADNIRRLTPLQVATSIRDFNNKGILADRYRAEVTQLQHDNFRKWFEMSVDTAMKGVESAQDRFNKVMSEEYAISRGSVMYSEELYKGTVTTQDGKKIEKSYKLDELKNIYLNGGRDSENNIVFDESSINKGSALNGSAGVSIDGIGVKNSANLHIDKNSKHGNSNSETLENFNSNTHGNDHVESQFDENHQTLTIGNSVFTRYTERKLIPSAQYVRDMESVQKELTDAQGKLFLYTDGELSRLYMLLDTYYENKASGMSWLVGRKYRNAIMHIGEPNEFVGD